MFYVSSRKIYTKIKNGKKSVHCRNFKSNETFSIHHSDLLRLKHRIQTKMHCILPVHFRCSLLPSLELLLLCSFYVVKATLWIHGFQYIGLFYPHFIQQKMWREKIRTILLEVFLSIPQVLSPSLYE